MPAQVNHLDAAFATLYAFVFVEMFFISTLRLRSLAAMVGLRTRAIAPALLWAHFLLYGLLSWYLLLALGLPAFPHHLAPMGIVMGIAFLLSNAWNPWQTRTGRAKRFEVCRGELWETVHALCDKVRAGGPWWLPEFSLCVVPDDSGFCGSTERPGVVLRRRYLELMSRAEVESVIARQMIRLSRRGALVALAPAVAAGVAAVGLFELLNMSLRSRLVALPFLLAAEIAILAVCSSWILLRFDLRAIRLTGNAEAFISAAAEAARLNGSALNMARLEALARKAGVPPGRLRALTEPRDHPPEDRYPTTGDYLTTGLA